MKIHREPHISFNSPTWDGGANGSLSGKYIQGPEFDRWPQKLLISSTTEANLRGPQTLPEVAQVLPITTGLNSTALSSLIIELSSLVSCISAKVTPGFLNSVWETLPNGLVAT